MADEATKAVKAIAHDAELYGEDDLAGWAPRITGKVQAMRGKRGLQGQLSEVAGDRLRFEGQDPDARRGGEQV